MYRSVVTGYEEKLNFLVSENTDLRNSLRSLQQELQELLTAQHIATVKVIYIYILNNTTAITRSMLIVSLFYPFNHPIIQSNQKEQQQIRDDQFNLPFDMVRDSIEDTLRSKMEIIRQQLLRLDGIDSDDSIDVLQEKVGM